MYGTLQAKDVVFFEAFARSQRSLVFPVNEPMEVKVRVPMPFRLI
jgi:hypothetical protein